jgi:hypothetical protein
MKPFAAFVLFIVGIILPVSLFGQDDDSKVKHNFKLELEAEYRYFYDEPLYPGQKSSFPSFAITPEYKASWNKGYESFTFKPFYRLDRDVNRTHFDIRELYYQKAKSNWELSVGLKKIYWGVAESVHLVDIINQTDGVESFDNEKKLGQPMVQYSVNTNVGTFDLFYMPYFRKRLFPGEKSRLRFPVVIEKDDVIFNTSNEEWNQDFAFRWAHSVGIFDLGLSNFYGTGREPIITEEPFGYGFFYDVINQTGVDIQITHDAFLWKIESIYRTSELQDMFAFAGGLEYTFGNVNGNGLDIGVLGEYLYDDRGDLAFTGAQNDVFFASRIALNDVQSTEFLIGGMFDLEKSSKVFSLEASRRVRETWKVEAEGRILSEVSKNDLILSTFVNDSFLRLTVFKYF